jgi:hypothetical protein
VTTSVPTLRPFWRYYGGKWRAAPRYPTPRHSTIIEPFAGAAGYSMRYPNRRVILVERYPVIAGIWRYLIAVKATEVRRIPTVDHVDDLPAWVPQEARWLVAMTMGAGTFSLRTTTSAGLLKRRAAGKLCEGWTEHMRERVAHQVDAIRHWQVVDGDYTAAPDVDATWFVDAPYAGSPGSHYVHGSRAIDYVALGSWCRARRGQVIVCEAEGATWLPFRPLGETVGVGGRRSREAVWLSDETRVELADCVRAQIGGAP